MTAEIAIMNKEAIALAADSAVTMTRETGEKTFTSANKLFALSKYHPVGIMVYGNALFMYVPWETIVKIYRNKLGRNKFETLKEYASDFIAFLDNGNPLFPNSVQDEYVHRSISAYFAFVKKTITEKIHSSIDQRGEIEDKAVKQIVSDIIEEQHKIWERASTIPAIPKSHSKNIADKYGEFIHQAMEEFFEELPISRRCSNQLKKIAAGLSSKFPEGIEKEGISGVVIAGFGEKDTFPSLESFDVEGIANNRLKYKEHISQKIDFETNA